MSRSGYSDDCDDYGTLNLWRANVDRTIAGKKGQAFLQELAAKMDEMPVKRLIAGELITPDGECCTIGVVCKSRGLKVEGVDVEDPNAVGKLVGVSSMLAQEIEYMNDEYGDYYSEGNETPEHRWTRMRKWVSENIKESK